MHAFSRSVNSVVNTMYESVNNRCFAVNRFLFPPAVTSVDDSLLNVRRVICRHSLCVDELCYVIVHGLMCIVLQCMMTGFLYDCLRFCFVLGCSCF